ncbi:hypothetical protein GCM10027399_14330 [Curvibacter fontanus]|uniref:hypothetical protein n=1 Tax=Hydrogenophaga sp. TaxID=1904254 RepID=UPI00271B1C01|nr:hypothetical protein [Hydrogenophaga sp.]MDO9220924.1 hypothetical protein [Thiobacillus sp.]MDP1619591.1 hypothetical protein [bacterium]MDP1936168.1 hypothetical protein [Hylemonella sp.]MDZ4102468.1 hypothetical protein [Hydrogenophaga sp.]
METSSNKQTRPSTISERIQRVVLIIMVLCMGLSLLIVAVGGTAFYLLDRHQVKIVKSTEAAGQVMAVTLSDGLFTRALVETSIGFYALIDGASLIKGQPLTLEIRGNADRYLCDPAHRCTRLINTW